MLRFVCIAGATAVFCAMPVIAQQTAPLAGIAACGDPALKFDVKTAEAPGTLSQPEPGKALAVFVAKDGGSQLASTTRVGMDGTWVGAIHGGSYFVIPVEPGVHHLCVVTKFNRFWSHPQEQGAAHFTAAAGEVYFFEAKNYQWPGAEQTDLVFSPLDSDEGPLSIQNLPVSQYQEKR